MSGLDIALSAAAVLMAAAGWMTGRSDTWLGCKVRLDRAYDRGWDESALAGTGGQADDDGLTVVLDSGRGAAGDGPAPPPGPPGLCPGGRRCVRGPEPHQWSTDCEEDEGWDDGADQPAADDEWANTLGTMRRELAAESERPASHTDQFSAIFSHMDGLERQVLLTWDLKQKFDRSRSKYLREAGISEKRIRELLHAD